MADEVLRTVLAVLVERVAATGREQPTGAGSHNTRAGQDCSRYPVREACPAWARQPGPCGPSDAFRSGQRLTSWPARTLLAIGSGSPVIARALADAPFALRPYLGPPLHALSRADAAARLPVPARGPAPGRCAVGHTGRAAVGWCLGRMAGSGRDRQAPATGAAVDRAALGARPTGSLRMDCGL